MHYPDPSPQRILVIRYRFIGDTVLAIPFLRNLRRAFPLAIIDVLTEPGCGATLVHCPYKNELIYFTPRQKTAWKTRSPYPTNLWGCARFLRQRHYDRAYILRRSFSSAILPLLARIPHRVGFATEGRNWLLQRSTPYADKHEVECFLDVLRADRIPVLDNYNENWSDPEVDRRVDRLLSVGKRTRVFICAKSIVTSKDWTPDRFGEVCAWLISRRDCEIHFCDSTSNASYYRSIVSALPPHLAASCFDWGAELALRDVNSLLRKMDLAFGIDTGLLHLAASFHLPILALFGPLQPWRWHPWDTRHVLIRPEDVSGPQPLLRISVEEIKTALEQFLPASK